MYSIYKYLRNEATKAGGLRSLTPSLALKSGNKKPLKASTKRRLKAKRNALALN